MRTRLASSVVAPPRTTLKDVAQAAGVSTAAASLALRGRPGVSPATRERVLETAESLRYAPNPTARSLRTARYDAVGLLLPQGATRTSYYAEFAFGVVDAADAHGRSVILLPHAPATRVPVPYVDGFIVVDAAADDPIVGALLDDPRPLVSGERVEGVVAPLASVASDHRSAMRTLLEHLHAQGARRIAALLPPADTTWGREVAEAYDAWCAERGHERLGREIGFLPTPDEVAVTTVELLAAGVDALVAVPSGSTAPAMTAAARAGRSVGADLLLAAYIDEPANAMVVPGITSLDLQARRLGEACLELLLEQIEDPTSPLRERSITPLLVPRASSRGG